MTLCQEGVSLPRHFKDLRNFLNCNDMQTQEGAKGIIRHQNLS